MTFPQVAFNDYINSMEVELNKKFKTCSKFTNRNKETFLFAKYIDEEGEETIITIAYKGDKGWVGSDGLIKMFNTILWFPAETFLGRVKVYDTMILKTTETLPHFAGEGI
jgi:hypothetical protein